MKKMKKTKASKNIANFKTTAKTLQRQQASKIKGGDLKRSSSEEAEVQ